MVFESCYRAIDADTIAVPVIAIFTKYDELVSRADREMDSSLRSKLDVSQISEHIKKEAEATRKKVCVLPFEKHTKKKVPHITVSSELIHSFVLSLFLILF